MAERFEAQHGRKIGAVSAAQLDAIRRAAGVKVPDKPPAQEARTPANDVHPATSGAPAPYCPPWASDHWGEDMS
jgi:hypothetical protein